MARLKPELVWNSGYFEISLRLSHVRRILSLTRHDFDVWLGDEKRQFDDIEDLALHWHALEGHFEIDFVDPTIEHSRLRLVVDNFGTILHGISRTPKMIALSDEIIRILNDAQTRCIPPTDSATFNQIPPNDEGSPSFISRNSDSIVVGAIVAIFSALLVAIAAKLGLPH